MGSGIKFFRSTRAGRSLGYTEFGKDQHIDLTKRYVWKIRTRSFLWSYRSEPQLSLGMVKILSLWLGIRVRSYWRSKETWHPSTNLVQWLKCDLFHGFFSSFSMVFHGFPWVFHDFFQNPENPTAWTGSSKSSAPKSPSWGRPKGHITVFMSSATYQLLGFLRFFHGVLMVFYVFFKRFFLVFYWVFIGGSYPVFLERQPGICLV